MQNNVTTEPGKEKEYFNLIRSEEVKNSKTGKYEDRDMVTMISNYLLKKCGGKKK